MTLYPPLGMQKTLMKCPRKCGGGQKGGEVGEEGPSPLQLIGTVRELWVGLDASAKGM